MTLESVVSVMPLIQKVIIRDSVTNENLVILWTVEAVLEYFKSCEYLKKANVCGIEYDTKTCSMVFSVILAD